MKKYNSINEIKTKWVHILNVEGLEETNISETKDITNIIQDVCSFIEQIVIEDVPHQYQERLLAQVKNNN